MSKVLVWVAAVCFIVGSGSAIAHEVVSGIGVNEAGCLEIGAVRAAIVHFDTGWANTQQSTDVCTAENGSPKITKQKWDFNGTFSLKNGTVVPFSETVKKVTSKSVSYQATFKSEKPVPTNTLALTFRLPVDSFSGKNIKLDSEQVVLPVDCTGQQVFASKEEAVKQIRIPLDGKTLTLTGKFRVYIQDERHYKGDSFSVRLMFDPSGGEITKTSLKLGIALK